MKNFFCGLIVGSIIVISITALADKIPAPPPLPKSEPALGHYLTDIYNNFHKLEVVTINPDGARSGQKGQMLLLQTGGNSYLEINTDGATQWRGVALTDTP